MGEVKTEYSSVCGGWTLRWTGLRPIQSGVQPPHSKALVFDLSIVMGILYSLD
jgi:hypothetical protein